MKTIVVMICLTALLIASEKYFCEIVRAQVDMERVQADRDRIRLQILQGIRPPAAPEDSYEPDPDKPRQGL